MFQDSSFLPAPRWSDNCFKGENAAAYAPVTFQCHFVRAELTKAVKLRAAISWVLLWWWMFVTHEFKKCKGRLGVNSKLGVYIEGHIFYYELIFYAAAGVFPSSDLRNALVFSRSGHGLRRAPFCCSAHKSQHTASASPVETQSADTLLDGPVDRVHPGAGIHLLPAVCTGHKTQSGSVPLSWPENNGVKGQPGSVTHWLAASPLGSACSLETRGHNQKWGNKKWEVTCQTTVILWEGETLPACWSWATAASAVEQKPHEGSVSQCKKKKKIEKEKHTVTRLQWNKMICVFCLAGGTVETAEEQHRWKAAHSFNW